MIAAGGPCTSNSSCAAGLACSEGLCGSDCAANPGAPQCVCSADDGNPCTVDSCDATSRSVTHAAAPAGTACPGLDACHGTGACDGAGRCLPGQPLAFDDGNPCTIETCDPLNGLTRRQCQPVDLTVASVVADTHAWVYSGPNPLQAGVTPGTIRRAQGSALRGRVLGEAGTPLGGVAVTVRNHPELGSTTTQTNGEYILVVNGGSPS